VAASRSLLDEHELVYLKHSRFRADDQTFHEGRRLEAVNGIYRITTTCGYTVRDYDPDRKRFFDEATALPARYAQLFARPCRRCWRHEEPVVVTTKRVADPPEQYNHIGGADTTFLVEDTKVSIST
jgi:hypothetical protein